MAAVPAGGEADGVQREEGTDPQPRGVQVLHLPSGTGAPPTVDTEFS